MPMTSRGADFRFSSWSLFASWPLIISLIIFFQWLTIKLQVKGHFTHETEGPCPLHSNIPHWSKKLETVQGHFILEGEGLLAQRNYHWWKVYMDLYTAYFIVWRVYIFLQYKWSLTFMYLHYIYIHTYTYIHTHIYRMVFYIEISHYLGKPQ